MNTQGILDDKKILVVDDEPDILETIEELLPDCQVDTAQTFDEAIDLLRHHTYDAAILDIMGVDGYNLLAVTKKAGILSIMFTAHALTPDHLIKSLEEQADAFVPKDMLADLPLYLSDLLNAKKKGRKVHLKWFSLLKPVFDRLFGDGWRKKDKDFWEEFDNKQLSSRDDIQKME